MRKFKVEILNPADEALIDACVKTLKNIPETEVNVSRPNTVGRSRKCGDATLTVEEHGVSTPYSVKCKTHLAAVVEATLRQVRAAAAAAADLRNTRPMIMAPYVNETLGECLRKENVDYVDGAGNAYIHTQVPPLLIFFRGRKPSEKPLAAGRLFHGISGLQLIALFLNATESVAWPYRDLAETAGISLV